MCNALALFQCVASHSETRELFLQAQIPLFLYPFLNTTSKTRPFEYLRLTALGVIGALVKQDDSTVRSSTLTPAASAVLFPSARAQDKRPHIFECLFCHHPAGCTADALTAAQL